eukprot:1394425-Rhodomonas_salina.1
MSSAMLQIFQRLSGPSGRIVPHAVKALSSGQQMERKLTGVGSAMRKMTTTAPTIEQAPRHPPGVAAHQEYSWRSDPDKKLWEKLYERDYKDRAQMAMFINAFQAIDQCPVYFAILTFGAYPCEHDTGPCCREAFVRRAQDGER